MPMFIKEFYYPTCEYEKNGNKTIVEERLHGPFQNFQEAVNFQDQLSNEVYGTSDSRTVMKNGVECEFVLEFVFGSKKEGEK